MAPSVFGDRFRRCSVDDSRIRSKTAPFSFENGLVWTGPESSFSEVSIVTSIIIQICKYNSSILHRKLEETKRHFLKTILG